MSLEELMNLPKARGEVPIVTVAITVLLAVAITATLLSRSFAT